MADRTAPFLVGIKSKMAAILKNFDCETMFAALKMLFYSPICLGSMHSIITVKPLLYDCTLATFPLKAT